MAPCCADHTLGPQANALLIALDSAFLACGHPVCRSFLIAANPQFVPLDVCCSCGDGEGQAWVSVGRTVPMNQTSAGVIPCITNFEVHMQVGVTRCAATVDSAGNPPDPDLISMQALQAFIDRKTMYSAIYDWINTQNIEIHDITVGNWNASVQGGCQVGTVDLILRISGGCC